MELSTHDIVVMSGEDGDTVSRLPVPDTDGLIVGTTKDPWIFVVKVNGANVIQVSCESELTTTRLVVPDLDLVVVSCRHEQRLRGMESNATDGAYQ